MNAQNNFQRNQKLSIFQQQKKIYLNKMNGIAKNFNYLKFSSFDSFKVNPKFQSFIYRSICQSKLKYGLEVATLTSNTRTKLNLLQNDLIRPMVKIYRHNHISSIRKVLKILNVDQLYFHSKLSFLRNIRFNNTYSKIIEYLQIDINNRPRSSKSIVKDFVLCEKYFNADFESIYNNISTSINKIKNEL